MELSTLDFPEVNSLSSKGCSKRDLSVKRVVLFYQGTHETSLPYPYHVTHEAQINHKAMYKGKYCRDRSYSYPMSKLLHPLPRLVEVDETLGADDQSQQQPQLPRVQELQWTDNQLSPEWLERINLFKASLEATHATEKNTSPTSNNAKEASFQYSQQTTSSNNPNLIPKSKANNVSDQSSNSEKSVYKSFQRRKPDSTYITMISGLTHYTCQSKLNGACPNSAQTADRGDRIAGAKLKSKGKACRNLKCVLLNGLVHRKLFRISPAADPFYQSNSLECVAQISNMAC